MTGIKFKIRKAYWKFSSSEKSWIAWAYYKDLLIERSWFSKWEEARDWTVKQIDMNRISS